MSNVLAIIILIVIIAAIVAFFIFRPTAEDIASGVVDAAATIVEEVPEAVINIFADTDENNLCKAKWGPMSFFDKNGNCYMKQPFKVVLDDKNKIQQVIKSDEWDASNKFNPNDSFTALGEDGLPSVPLPKDWTLEDQINYMEFILGKPDEGIEGKKFSEHPIHTDDKKFRGPFDLDNYGVWKRTLDAVTTSTALAREPQEPGIKLNPQNKDQNLAFIESEPDKFTWQLGGQSSTALKTGAFSCPKKYPATNELNAAFLDIGKRECWSCPKNAKIRTLNPIGTTAACVSDLNPFNTKRITSPGVKRGKEGCGSGSFHTILTGDCHRCPTNFRRTIFSVNAKNACELECKKSWNATKLEELGIGSGVIQDLTLGCYATPLNNDNVKKATGNGNWIRSAAEITANNAFTKLQKSGAVLLGPLPSQEEVLDLLQKRKGIQQEESPTETIEQFLSNPMMYSNYQRNKDLINLNSR